MNGLSKTPSYNLKVVIRETGLKADIQAGFSFLGSKLVGIRDRLAGGIT